jgi:Ca-activated chloride channel family protein
LGQQTSVALLTAIAVGFLSVSIAAQELQHNEESPVDTSSLKVETDLVSFNVTVTDGRNEPIRGLNRENFRVFEDGVEQPVEHFSDDDYPYTMGLVLDRSGSMAFVIEDVYNAAFHTIRASKRDDEFFVITFNQRAELLQDFSSDRKLLQRALRGVEAGGSTALYDAIYTGLKHLDRGQHDKKALLVVTDGADNSSSLKFRELLEFIRERHVTIYVVGFFEGMSPESCLFGDTFQVDSLKKIAEVAGGKAYFPRSMKECDNACIAIANELRKQYSLGYYPTNKDKDGSWREIRVEVSPPPSLGSTKLIARTREGYNAPAQ